MSRGPAPKPPGQRIRRNRDPSPHRVVDIVAVPQPPLDDDALPEGERWHPATRKWWALWGASPITAEWDALVWAELEVAAMLHHRFHTTGAAAAATELRLRTAKLGAAPDDRLRLRIVNAEADRRDEQRTTTTGAAARQRYARVTHLQPASTPGAHPERTERDHHDHRSDHPADPDESGGRPDAG